MKTVSQSRRWLERFLEIPAMAAILDTIPGSAGSPKSLELQEKHRPGSTMTVIRK
ncbi:MAG TPA: hypothetical protein VGJ93_15740 [Desulfuromonadaceae bacterium]